MKNYFILHYINYTQQYKLQERVMQQEPSEKIEQGISQEDQESQEDQSQFQEEDSQSSLELRQPAFPLEQMVQDENADEDQLEAFNYLLKVRQEACKIKQKAKQSRNKHVFVQQNLKSTQKQSNQNQVPEWLRKWSDQTLQNWRKVILNVQYSIRNCQFQIPEEFKNKQKMAKTQKYNLFRSRFSLSKIPSVKQLAFLLTLDEVQTLISQLSAQYYEDLSNEQKQMSKLRGKYYLWMFSLLSVHQARASYAIFQALASINSCLFAQKVATPQLLTVCVILEQHFQQRHLKKLISRSYQQNSSVNKETAK